MEIKVPRYAKQFKCIGGACKDSCCIGWDVDVDKATYERYRSTSNAQMNKAFKKHVYINPYVTDLMVDFAKIELTDDKRCAFLNSENWCLIQKHLGEEYLSNVCSSYPRIFHKIDGQMIMTLNPSCPEAAKLLLEDDLGVNWENVKVKEAPKIITFDVNTSDKRYKKTPVKDLVKVQKTLFDILTNKDFTYDQKLIVMGVYIDGVLKQQKNHLDSEKMIEKLTLKLRRPEAFSDKMGLFLTDKTTLSDLAYPDWNNKLKNEPVLKMTEHKAQCLLKYYENLMVKNLFPYTEGSDIWEAYLLLIARDAILSIEFPKVDFHKEADYLQAFTKAFDHNRNLPEQVFQWMKMNQHYAMKQLFFTE